MNLCQALDRARKAEILPYLRDIPLRFGLPALYVSHAVEEIAQLADTVVILADGRVRAAGPTASVLGEPGLDVLTGRFEAGALIEAQVTAHDDAHALTRLDFEGQTLTMPQVEALAPGDHVRLRIRARDVALATRRPEAISIRNIISGTVASLTPDPGTAFVEAIVTVGAQRLRARITHEASAALNLRVDASVHALVKSASFDRRALIARNGSEELTSL